MINLYVIQSLKDKSFYIGITDNLERRLGEHNNGQVASTKSRRPFLVYHSEIFETRREAMRMERYLKSLKKRSAIEKVVKNFRNKIGTAAF